VVRCQDDSFWEIAFESAVSSLSELTGYRSVAGNANRSRRPPLCTGRQQQSGVLLAQSLPRIVKVAVDEVKWQTEKLCAMNAAMSVSTPSERSL